MLKKCLLLFFCMVAGCVGGAISNYMFQSEAVAQGKVDFVRTKALIIEDAQGKERMVIGNVKNTMGIVFADDSGNQSIFLGVNSGKPALTFFHDNKLASYLGWSKGNLGLYLFDSHQKPRLMNAITANGVPFITLSSHDMNESLGLAYNDGVPLLQFFHDGKQRAILALSSQGDGHLVFLNSSENKIIQMGESSDGGGSLEVADKFGKSIWQKE